MAGNWGSNRGRIQTPRPYYLTDCMKHKYGHQKNLLPPDTRGFDRLIFVVVMASLYGGLYSGFALGKEREVQNVPMQTVESAQGAKIEATEPIVDPCHLADVMCEGEVEAKPVSKPSAPAPLPSNEVAEQIREIAAEKGFASPDYLVRLAHCESTLNPNAVGDHGMSRGLFQIHAGYNPHVSDACAFDVRCSAEWTINMLEQGLQSRWSCDRKLKS